MQNVHIVYLFFTRVACIIMYYQDYQEINMHYPGRKPVYALRLVSIASS